MYFLLIYDRERSQLLVEQQFERRREALQARFAAEKEYRDDDRKIEVVVVGAPSRQALMRTHGRYFLSLRELAERASGAVAL